MEISVDGELYEVYDDGMKESLSQIQAWKDVYEASGVTLTTYVEGSEVFIDVSLQGWKVYGRYVGFADVRFPGQLVLRIGSADSRDVLVLPETTKFYEALWGEIE